MAAEGTLFHDCLSQAPWTLPSTTSLLTSLYPTTHGVTNMYDHRLSDSATTLAEVFRDAGYATLSFSSMHYSGSGYNLGQGFEELHESNSAIEARKSSGGGTAREYVNRLLPWLEKHREVPFFVFLHTYEAKGKPYPPYDTLWAESSAKEKLQTYSKKLGRPVTPEKVEQAGIDPNDFITLTKDLYDGMIRILDTEIGRLFKGVEELGLDDKTLVIFMSDHGQEFFDHGVKIDHYGSYSEVTHVPLIVRWPGVIPQGAQIYETVRTIDVMPTILQLCHLPVPRVAQGQSLLPLFAKAQGASDLSSPISNKAAVFTTAQWRNEPAVCEFHLAGRENRWDPNYRDSHAIILDGWKLIQFFQYKEEKPERIELYNHRKDPLEQVNLADKHPEIVERLIREFNTWKEKAAAAPLASDSESEQKLDSETLKRLRSLGYVR
jgi:arylsulfatase A-like enzyme